MFNKILIANRGEIACRIIETARRLGVATVAVYSDADHNALHVDQADEAIHIGAAPARDSYLLAKNVLAAAQACGAQAIHPGYGFLSENAQFAAGCAAQGISFIGPSVTAIEAMGSKSAAKQIMSQANVPLLPGYHGSEQNAAFLRSQADAIGYPVLLKATAGGGGKGMREVHDASAFDAALTAAKTEALTSFADDSMLVEKYLCAPRHVEVQIFFDHHGNGIYLADRDCSVQRRHQKIIEEAPAPNLTAQLRKAMGNTAIKAGQAINYRGAGTVEFLLDANNQFYFMEMNTRLQVEHPVTEMITGQDLVEWQLLVACGAPLPLTQDQVQVRGHAFEARVYAEDPDNDFMPVTGKLGFMRAPPACQQVRIDTGVRQGDVISVYYDPLIAKLIVWGEDREQALIGLHKALAQYQIAGTVTNLEFLQRLTCCRPFAEARLSTHFLHEHQTLLFPKKSQHTAQDLTLAALALLLHKRNQNTLPNTMDLYSPWHDNNAWRLNEPNKHHLTLISQQQEHRVVIEQCSATDYRIELAGAETLVRGTLQDETLYFETAGHRQRGTLAHTEQGFTLYLPTGACCFKESTGNTGELHTDDNDRGLRAPMTGTVVSLLAGVGSLVKAETPLLAIEAMKMEHTIRAPCSGMVTAFHYQRGDLVDGGAMLLDFVAQQP